MANTYLTRTPSSASNRRTWTFSAWVKRSDQDGVNVIFQQGATADYFKMNFQGGVLRWRGVTSGSNEAYLTTNRVFRDASAWYHIVASFDSTNTTAGDRMRLYINGVEETSFSTDVNPSLNYEGYVNSTDAMEIGRSISGNDSFFDGEMSHINFCDGTAYDATAFGEYDANGVWKIKTDVSVTYGTNGFFILKDGNSVTDQSGNTNNFTVGGGTLTNTEDSPSNVFATLNPLARFQVAPTYSNGNNTITAGVGGSGSSPFSTIGASSGKYYAELSLGSVNGGGISCGIIDITQFNPNFQTDAWFYYPTYGYAYMSSNGNKGNNNAETSYATSYTNGDRIGVAMDLDNNKLYFAKNGVWQNSGDPTSGATGTGAAFTIADGTYGFAVYGYDSKVWNANFGNGYFGTTAVSSAGTNASGIGIFEYDVPTGYTALSTKGLNL